MRKWGRWNEKFAEKSNRKQKIAVGSRAQNAFIERFNRTYWEEIFLMPTGFCRRSKSATVRRSGY